MTYINMILLTLLK